MNYLSMHMQSHTLLGRALTLTFAPSFNNSFTQARPMPDEPPVTMATRPSKRRPLMANALVRIATFCKLVQLVSYYSDDVTYSKTTSDSLHAGIPFRM
jgi:hypothetical protein